MLDESFDLYLSLYLCQQQNIQRMPIHYAMHESAAPKRVEKASEKITYALIWKMLHL